MIEWVQSWAKVYDLSLLNAAICIAAALLCIWLTQCMTKIPRAPLWAVLAIVAHRALLLALACAFMLCAANPYLEPGNYPWTGDVALRAVLLVMLLIWPRSSRARRLYGPHV